MRRSVAKRPCSGRSAFAEVASGRFGLRSAWPCASTRRLPVLRRRFSRSSFSSGHSLLHHCPGRRGRRTSPAAAYAEINGTSRFPRKFPAKGRFSLWFWSTEDYMVVDAVSSQPLSGPNFPKTGKKERNTPLRLAPHHSRDVAGHALPALPHSLLITGHDAGKVTTDLCPTTR